MPISKNEIRKRATAFVHEWKDAHDEDADAKSFWDGFFQVFGVPRRKVALFEHHVKKLNDKHGFIDLYWPGKLVVEHKSLGKDLGKAHGQAVDYLAKLADHELPRYIIVSDFARIHLHDLETSEAFEMQLAELPKHIDRFDFISGYTAHALREQDPVNIKAAELMGRLHDELKANGYDGHPLEVLLVRLLFCLFADDTGIFESSALYDWIEGHTKEDGSDLGMQLERLFQLLNTPEDKRQKNLDERLKDFKYINGKLFEERLPISDWDAGTRVTLLECAALDWGRISPAIFGALFQSVMDPRARRDLGAHYTSEQNILKLIKPLFLDALWEEFNAVRHTAPSVAQRAKQNRPLSKLEQFHSKLSKLRFLDPACGCGNFLVITYRELRRLEIAVIEALMKGQQVTDVDSLILLNVDQFYGIEIEEFPSQIAQVALWLTDHQLNQEVSQAFGEYMVRIPLRKSATILHANALRTDWASLLTPQASSRRPGAAPATDVTPEAGRPKVVGPGHPESHEGPATSHTETHESIGETPGLAFADAASRRHGLRSQSLSTPGATGEARNDERKYDYILGNPPFIGHQWRTEEQQQDHDRVWNNAGRTGRLDFVTCWFRLAAEYAQGKDTAVAFVATNSITQGEQPAILWSSLNALGMHKSFACRTFKWNNEGRGVAQVHVVVIGFQGSVPKRRLIYETVKGLVDPEITNAANINGYLIDAQDAFLESRGNPIWFKRALYKGSQPTDGGGLILENDALNELKQLEPNALKWVRPFVGAQEFINGNYRSCLWLKNISPAELRELPIVLKHLETVKAFRLSSPTASVREYAKRPALFTQDRQPDSNYLVIPEVTSENRRYIPIGFLGPNVIASNKLQIVPEADLWTFGLVQSFMHMAWTRVVCGRLELRLSYSPAVYNNYPWPESPTEAQRAAVEAAAQGVLDARAAHPGASLADLYDPLTMPANLVKAHAALDKAVDQCYRKAPFTSEPQRVAYLFELYEKYAGGLLAGDKPKRKKR